MRKLLRLAAMAVVPYTTLCSPNRMSLPGAEQRTVVMPSVVRLLLVVASLFAEAYLMTVPPYLELLTVVE